MDLVMYALVIFTDVYCRGNKKKATEKSLPLFIYLLQPMQFRWR